MTRNRVQSFFYTCFAVLQSVKFIDEVMSIKTDKLGSDVLLAAAKTSMGSKIVGAESDFFGRLVVDAIKAVETTDQVRKCSYLWFRHV